MIQHRPIRFFLIGTPKSATTTLCYHLASHPQVAFCTTKEPNFFNDDHTYSRGYAYYESLFPHRDGPLAIGEGSPRYCLVTRFPDTPTRIQEYAPDARIIYVVRQPLDRIRSYVRQQRDNRWVDPRHSLLDVIRNSPDVLDSGRYFTHLSTYRLHFPKDQVLVLFYEDFLEDPGRVFEDLARFLGIDSRLRTTDLGEMKNVAGEKAAEPTWVWRARSFPHISRLVSIQQKQFIFRQLRRLHRPLPADKWTPEAVDFVRSELEDEVSSFLSLIGRPANSYSWDVPAEGSVGRRCRDSNGSLDEESRPMKRIAQP